LTAWSPTSAIGIDAIMSNGRNAQDQTYHNSSTRRLRVDDMAAIVVRNSLGPPGNAPSGLMSRGHSGRLLVIGAGCTLLVIWGTLYLVFRDWRARYRERALYGATQVLPAVDRLRSIVPPDVDPALWRRAVDQTGSMLITVTGSNLLDVKDMDKLRFELDEHVGRATDRPETAVRELADLWDEIADRGEFLFNDSRSVSGIRHPRPIVLPPKLANPPVDSVAPAQ
jgi:hypothetical protein